MLLSCTLSPTKHYLLSTYYGPVNLTLPIFKCFWLLAYFSNRTLTTLLLFSVQFCFSPRFHSNTFLIRAPIFKLLRAQESIPRNQFRQGSRYDNPIPTRFLAPIDCWKFQHSFIDTDILQYHTLTTIHNLKVPKCEIFDPFFFTSVNPIWVGDLRTGEKKNFVRRLRQIFAILVFLRMLSLR
jgi:hypothetical protein